MVLEMCRRGVRIDSAAAEHARELLLRKRDATLADLSEKLGTNVSMGEIGRTKWLAETSPAPKQEPEPAPAPEPEPKPEPEFGA